MSGGGQQPISVGSQSKQGPRSDRSSVGNVFYHFQFLPRYFVTTSTVMTSNVSHSNLTAEGRWLWDGPGESKKSEDKAEGTRLRDTQLRDVCFHSGKTWAGGRFCQKRESELL